ncbi:alpha/beta fold hydrolase [Nonomuraea sp. CA-218870]|uniref:alpha/beta fold hydrolase n=1 Tax=Nonomuraea sp. CA-218870 TaxID=3239998 RepID=UPI003D8B1220
MPAVTSPDGTLIGYERSGSGPALVLVDGAMCYRAAGPMRPLAALLSSSFTVYAYDRRGRGESGDTPPYAPDREVEDLQTVIGEAGGEAYVYGISSGAALAMRAAATGSGITRLALYEPPFIEGPGNAGYTTRLREALAAGRRGDAVALFMAHVGMPPQAIDGMRGQPMWPALEAIAPTLAYDDELLCGGRVPRDLASAITVPVLVLSGAASSDGLQRAAEDTADAIPTAEHRSLDGQTHDVQADALAPALTAFFTG